MHAHAHYHVYKREIGLQTSYDPQFCQYYCQQWFMYSFNLRWCVFLNVSMGFPHHGFNKIHINHRYETNAGISSSMNRAFHWKTGRRFESHRSHIFLSISPLFFVDKCNKSCNSCRSGDFFFTRLPFQNSHAFQGGVIHWYCIHQ